MTKNLHAESAVIGSLLIDNSSLDDVAYLQPEDFSLHSNRELFRAIKNLIHEGKSADIISVSDRVSKNDSTVFCEVASIANGSFTSANIRHYAELVRESSTDRKLIAIGQQIISSVKNGTENRLDHAQRQLAEITDLCHFEISRVGDVLGNVLQKIDERFNNPSDINGLATGFTEIDRLTHGLQPDHLIILAARPSMGKTLLAMNIAEYAAIDEKKSVLIFSLEMDKEELLERSISSLGRINGSAIKTGRLAQRDFDRIVSLSSKYADAKLFIEDGSELNVFEMRSRCRRIKREHGLDLVVIDYLTLVSGKGENETDRITKISRSLKLLARDLGVPVLLVSQLNRAVDARQDKRPMMSDLRQSGAIEQDADLILFIYRDEIYNQDSPHKGIAEIIVAKNRHGKLGTVYLDFNGEFCRFDNLTRKIVAMPEKRASGAGFYDQYS
jgi:replicative DNA helicase